MADSGHPCDGELMVDVYFDGTWHLGVSVWYPCDSHLDLLGSVPLPS
jgi:hypothetical protein